MFFALLVYCDLFNEVYASRLPVGYVGRMCSCEYELCQPKIYTHRRHTHIDIDARHSLYTRRLFGRGEGAGSVEQIMTPSEFDKEVGAAYKSDTFRMIRMTGLLDVYDAWGGVLQYSNFGPSRLTEDAIAQGGKDPSPHSFRFIKAMSSGKMTVLMQYKYHELEQQWHPPDVEGIPVFPDDFPSPEEVLDRGLPLLTPSIWDFDTVKARMMKVWKFNDIQRAEWEQFFDSIPICTDDIKPSDAFKWTLPALVARKKQFREDGSAHVPVRKKSGPSPPVEVVVWSQHTKKNLKEEQRLRRIQHSTNSDDSESCLDDDKSSQSSSSCHSMTTRGRSRVMHVSFYLIVDVHQFIVIVIVID
jgi:hypothetical protein